MFTKEADAIFLKGYCPSMSSNWGKLVAALFFVQELPRQWCDTSYWTNQS